jgi:hypothetical protein
MKRVIFIILILIFCQIHLLYSDIPKQISYQGILTDQQMIPLPDGNYDIQFRLYTSDSEQIELWSEQQTVIINNGVFDVYLGTVNPLNLSFDRQYWLGVTLSGEAEMSPRIPLVSVPYSMNAEAAFTVPGYMIKQGYKVIPINPIAD